MASGLTPARNEPVNRNVKHHVNYRATLTTAYSRLHDVLESNAAPSLAELLGYKYPDSGSAFPYGWMERDYTRELVNAFNQNVTWLNRLAAWELVLKDYADDEAIALRYEFTAVPLDFCLHFPYRFQQRLTFCSTQLCYTAGIERKLIQEENVQREDRINLSSLTAVAHHWSSCKVLIDNLKKIDAEEFRAATSNYRNKAQHRSPQRLDFGHVAYLERTFLEEAHVSYTFGDVAPLQSAEILPVLAVEVERLKAAFLAYRVLVEEHAQ